jgi:hypothetical protein
MNFNATTEDTVVTFTWDPPTEDSQNGDIVSYYLSCSIGSAVQFELNLTSSVEEISLGVYEVSSTYSCSVSASNSAGQGPTASTNVTTSDSSTPAYLPFILLDSFYESSNAVNLPVVDDSASSAITLPTTFPFGDTDHTSAYVGTNGYITFGTSAYIAYSNTAFPGTSGQYIVAAFWDDIDIRNGGSITYEIFESGYFLDVVNEYLKRIRPTSFEGTWMLVASFDKVEPYSGSGENTFQIIIISDGEFSYSILTYKCGFMEWDNNANIGYSAGGDP